MNSLTRTMWIVGSAAALVLAVSAVGRPTAKPGAPAEAVFAHRFTEIRSDRVGFRKYVGDTSRCMITGTLLGIDDDSERSVPAGAIGAIALAHSMYYFGSDFSIVQKPGRSVVYTAMEMELPAELIK